MKRHGGLWDDVVSWENLLLAASKARSRKRAKPVIRRFQFNLEHELIRLQRELEEGRYCPGPFTTHWITRPKARLISAAPFRDRVIHHAIMNVLEPILDRRFHPDSSACRRGQGSHAASSRLQYWMARRAYALQCDVSKFFPSIDHDILKATFRRVIKDQRVLELMDLVVDRSNAQERVQEWFEGDSLLTPVERRRGLPIGNLTSQWFANWMLDGLDHFVTARLGLGAYVRYCDDFIILSDDPTALREALSAVRGFLAERRLRLNERKAQIRPTRVGLTFVGFRTWATHRTLRKSNIRALRRRVRWMRRAYAQRRIDWPEVRQRLASWMGHAKQADSHRLLARLSMEWRFVRGDAALEPCPSRRVVEQQPAEPAFGQPQQEHTGQPQQQQRFSSCPALPASASMNPESPCSRMGRE